MSNSNVQPLTRPNKIAYALIALILVGAGLLKLATPLLAVMFCLFLLNKLHFTKNKLIAVALFAIVLSGIAYAAAHFARAAIVALPKMADTSVPKVILWAETHGIELPFTDFKTLKEYALEAVKEQAHYLGNFANIARGVTTHVVLLIIAAVVAVSLFLKSQLDLDRGSHAVKDNLYELCCESISERFELFYNSFVTVMGAQILISTINTLLTSIFLFAAHVPNAPVLVGVTFLCGMLPVVGNLVSNTVIVVISFTISAKMALAALIFLVVIHKLEYLLNSKIIGDRIRNPIWLTLLGLVVGEKLIGIPGMILAPVILNYIKVEASRIQLKQNESVEK